MFVMFVMDSNACEGIFGIRTNTSLFIWTTWQCYPVINDTLKNGSPKVYQNLWRTLYFVFATSSGICIGHSTKFSVMWALNLVQGDPWQGAHHRIRIWERCDKGWARWDCVFQLLHGWAGFTAGVLRHFWQRLACTLTGAQNPRLKKNWAGQTEQAIHLFRFIHKIINSLMILWFVERPPHYQLVHLLNSKTPDKQSISLDCFALW